MPGVTATRALRTQKDLLRAGSFEFAFLKKVYGPPSKTGRTSPPPARPCKRGTAAPQRPTTSGEWLRSFAIITTQANELVADIHDRMPVILAPPTIHAGLATSLIRMTRMT
jgi:hypothetical protein